MLSTSASPSTIPPGGLLQQGPPLLKIEPAILTRWIIVFRSSIIIGFILVIASLPLLTRMYHIDRSDSTTRTVGPVFFPTGLYLMAVGIFFERVLRGYRNHMLSLNVTVGDSNVGAYVRTTELFDTLPVLVRPPPNLSTNVMTSPIRTMPGTSEESNFVEIQGPYASFSSMGIPPPPYRP